MTTDPFTTAAEQEAVRVTEDGDASAFGGFISGAQWAREQDRYYKAMLDIEAEKQSLEMKIHRVEKLLEAAMNAYDGKDALYQVTPSVSVHKIREALGETESR